jgi:hypothetical protein
VCFLDFAPFSVRLRSSRRFEARLAFGIRSIEIIFNLLDWVGLLLRGIFDRVHRCHASHRTELPTSKESRTRFVKAAEDWCASIKLMYSAYLQMTGHDHRWSDLKYGAFEPAVKIARSSYD